MLFESGFSLKSLRTRITLVVLGIGLLTTLSFLFYEQKVLVRTITQTQEESALNLVNTVALSIDSQYRSILFHKSASLEKRKAMLRSVIDLAMSQVEDAYEQVQAGNLSEEAAKKQAMDSLRKMRYDNNVGYLWINTMDLPFPRMIMHATIPELDGQILDEPRFNCALGRDENLFRAMVEVCRKNKKGYVDYLWPKPTEQGLTDRQPKLSYVELFEPWGWVVGTGLYIDDIDRDVEERLEAVVSELKIALSRVKVAQTGYMFLFSGNEEMLIHPYLVGADFSKIPNPSTGNSVLKDLKEAAHTPSRKLLYIWDKPPKYTGEFRFRKLAFVNYFEPLDWYLASTIYYDEMEQPAREARNRVMALGSALLAIGLLLSLWLSSSLTRPLMRLSQAAKTIHGSDTLERVPVSGTVETQELGEVLNNMLTTLQDEITERKQAESTLKDALQEKEVLLREVHHRVKNNLAVVVSLLSMQAKRVDDSEVRRALEESRSRISAMSLIHETLYRSDNLAEIPLHEYLGNVYTALQHAIMHVPGGVVFEMTGDTVNLTVEQAVPCGLILNELITNSLKYGYPRGGPGTIRLDAKIEENGWLQLDYHDDGVGLPANFDPKQNNTLGMRIVRLLVESQLNGKLRWETGPGAHFSFGWFVSNMEDKE